MLDPNSCRQVGEDPSSAGQRAIHAIRLNHVHVRIAFADRCDGIVSGVRGLRRDRDSLCVGDRERCQGGEESEEFQGVLIGWKKVVQRGRGGIYAETGFARRISSAFRSVNSCSDKAPSCRSFASFMNSSAKDALS